MRAAFTFLGTTIIAIAALTITSGARADVQDSVNTWYRLVVSDDGAEVVYLDKGFRDSHTRAGWVAAGVLSTEAGPRVADGVVARYTFINFVCTDRTMAVSDVVTYDAFPKRVEAVFIDDDKLAFQPVPIGDQLDLAYQIVCGKLDPSGLQDTGPVTLAQLIASDTAAYASKARQ